MSPCAWKNNKAILFYFTQNSASEIWFGTGVQRGRAFGISDLPLSMKYGNPSLEAAGRESPFLGYIHLDWSFCQDELRVETERAGWLRCTGSQCSYWVLVGFSNKCFICCMPLGQFPDTQLLLLFYFLKILFTGFACFAGERVQRSPPAVISEVNLWSLLSLFHEILFFVIWTLCITHAENNGKKI